MLFDMHESVIECLRVRSANGGGDERHQSKVHFPYRLK
jgi:hypothetical protein